MLQLLLNGRGYDSFSARNVDLMMTGALQLTNFLLKYSSVWFLLGSIAALLGCTGREKAYPVGGRVYVWHNGAWHGSMVHHAGCGMLGL